MMKPSAVAAILFSALIIGCGGAPESGPEGDSDATETGGDETSGDETSSTSGGDETSDDGDDPIDDDNDDGGDPADTEECTASTLIYVVGHDLDTAGFDPSMPSGTLALYTFDPATTSLERIGDIPCVAVQDAYLGWEGQWDHCKADAAAWGGGCHAPLAVGPDGVAWLITGWGYDDFTNQAQRAFRIDTSDASCIGDPLTIGSPDQRVTGAAFAVAPGSTEEKLRVSLRSMNAPGELLRIGEMDTTTGDITSGSTIPGAAIYNQEIADWWWAGTSMTTDDEGHLLVADGWWWWNTAQPSNLFEIDAASDTLLTTTPLPSTLMAPLSNYAYGGHRFAWADGAAYFFGGWWWYDQNVPRPVIKLNLDDLSVTEVVAQLDAAVFSVASRPCVRAPAPAEEPSGAPN